MHGETAASNTLHPIGAAPGFGCEGTLRPIHAVGSDCLIELSRKGTSASEVHALRLQLRDHDVISPRDAPRRLDPYGIVCSLRTHASLAAPRGDATCSGQRACPHAQLGTSRVSQRRLTGRLWNTASCFPAALLTHSQHSYAVDTSLPVRALLTSTTCSLGRVHGALWGRSTHATIHSLPVARLSSRFSQTGNFLLHARMYTTLTLGISMSTRRLDPLHACSS
jgi:hypothetical protein